MFEIRSYFIILISGFLSVLLFLKKNKLHHFIKHCKSIVFSRLAEKNIRSNLHNINRMSRILFMKWRKNMLATARENLAGTLFSSSKNGFESCEEKDSVAPDDDARRRIAGFL